MSRSSASLGVVGEEITAPSGAVGSGEGGPPAMIRRQQCLRLPPPQTWPSSPPCQVTNPATALPSATPTTAGRTYRYWRGDAPLFDFGFGLSYVRFNFSAPTLRVLRPKPGVGTVRLLIADEEGTPGGSSSGGAPAAPAVATAAVQVSNAGDMPADTAVLLFLSYLGPDAAAGPNPRTTIPASGCSSSATGTHLVQRLVAYERTGELAPGQARRLTFELRLGAGSKSSWAGFGDPEPPCGAYALSFGQDQPQAATVVLVP